MPSANNRPTTAALLLRRQKVLQYNNEVGRNWLTGVIAELTSFFQMMVIQRIPLLQVSRDAGISDLDVYVRLIVLIKICGQLCFPNRLLYFC